MLVYREFHGDLHPGNILVARQSQLYFIDWGNTIDLSPIWQPALKYLQAVLAGDAQAITNAIIELAAEPRKVAESRGELAELVSTTLANAGVTPLGYDFALTLYHEGQEGLLKRLELAIQLATAIGRQGIVIRAEYMHLTRSLTAMVGSYLGIYRGLPRRLLFQDIAQVLMQFPTLEGWRFLSNYRKTVLKNVLLKSPLRILPFIANKSPAETGQQLAASSN
jgi:hypothetical protein